MAISFHCDYCGEALCRDHDGVEFSVVERGSGAGTEALNRMGLNGLDDRIKEAFHFHLNCFERAMGMIDNHRRWAQGDGDAAGLKWELVEQVDHPWQRRRPAVLEPIYRNRILALCRESAFGASSTHTVAGRPCGGRRRSADSYPTAACAESEMCGVGGQFQRQANAWARAASARPTATAR